MNDLRTAAQQALEAWQGHQHGKCSLEKAVERFDALRAALAQQAEPDAYGYASYLAVAIWEKYYKDTAPHWKPLDDLVGVLTQIDNMTSGLTRLAQQAEPLNLADPGVQKRLATQWGYVPAAQAEPVEQLAELQAMLRAEVDRLIAAGIQPQRKPLTEEEIESCRQKGYAHAGLGAPFDFGKAARAVEKASWEKNHGQA